MYLFTINNVETELHSLVANLAVNEAAFSL